MVTLVPYPASPSAAMPKPPKRLSQCLRARAGRIAAPAAEDFVFDYSNVPKIFTPGGPTPRPAAALCHFHKNRQKMPFRKLLLRLLSVFPPISCVEENFSCDRAFTIDYKVQSDYKVSMAQDNQHKHPSASGGQSPQITPDSPDTPDSPAPAGRAQRRAGRTRQRLLAAALHKFSDRGVDATTIEEITEKADVGKGTFYRHFSSKDEVVLALVEEAVDHLVSLMAPPAKAPAKLEDALSGLLAAHARFFQEHTDEFVLLFQGRVLLKLQREIGEDLEAPYQRYLNEIERRIGPLTVQPVDHIKTRRLSCAVAGFVSGFFSFAMIGMEPQEIEQSIAPLRTAFLAASSTFLAGV